MLPKGENIWRVGLGEDGWAMDQGDSSRGTTPISRRQTNQAIIRKAGCECPGRWGSAGSLMRWGTLQFCSY